MSTRQGSSGSVSMLKDESFWCDALSMHNIKQEVELNEENLAFT